jgi:hypothetical protein
MKRRRARHAEGGFRALSSRARHALCGRCFLVAVLTVGLAVLMGVLLPGAGVIATLLVLALSVGMIAGLVLAAASGPAPRARLSAEPTTPLAHVRNAWPFRPRE